MKNYKEIIHIGHMEEPTTNSIITFFADAIQEVVVPNPDVPGLEKTLKLPVVACVLNMSLN
jgi:hypothetical protein